MATETSPLAQDGKLIPHRWDMHALQALVHRDHALLRRVFTTLTLPTTASVDTKVKMFGFGAPAQFHSYGFFDRHTAPGSPVALLNQVVDGDTLLLIALRHHDALSATVLIELGASLHEANSDGETPLQRIADAFAAIQLHDKQQQQSSDSGAASTTHWQTAVLDQRAAFSALFALVQDEIDSSFAAVRASVCAELEAIYTAHTPERLAKLPAQLDDFAYRERELLAVVRQKYLA